jgi:hypothetical protein
LDFDPLHQLKLDKFKETVIQKKEGQQQVPMQEWQGHDVTMQMIPKRLSKRTELIMLTLYLYNGQPFDIDMRLEISTMVPSQVWMINHE